jgi:hypothetical protein
VASSSTNKTAVHSRSDEIGRAPRWDCKTSIPCGLSCPPRPTPSAALLEDVRERGIEFVRFGEGLDLVSVAGRNVHILAPLAQAASSSLLPGFDEAFQILPVKPEASAVGNAHDRDVTSECPVAKTGVGHAEIPSGGLCAEEPGLRLHRDSCGGGHGIFMSSSAARPIEQDTSCYEQSRRLPLSNKSPNY